MDSANDSILVADKSNSLCLFNSTLHKYPTGFDVKASSCSILDGVVWSGYGKHISVMDLSTGMLLKRFSGHLKRVELVIAGPARVASFGRDEALIFWK